MANKEPKNEVFEQQFYRYGFHQEEHGRDVWNLKYGKEYCDKIAATYKISDQTRAKFGQPSAVQKQEVEVFDLTKLPKEFQKTTKIQLDADNIGLWGDANIDYDLFPPTGNSKLKTVWD